jgi:hypothetical protein
MIDFADTVPDVILMMEYLSCTSVTTPEPVCFSGAPRFAPVAGSIRASPGSKISNASPTLIPACPPILM